MQPDENRPNIVRPSTIRFDESVKRRLDRYVFEAQQSGADLTIGGAVNEAVRQFLDRAEGVEKPTEEILTRSTIASAESRSTMSVTETEQEAIDALLSILRSGDAGATDAILSNVRVFVRVIKDAPDITNSVAAKSSGIGSERSQEEPRTDGTIYPRKSDGPRKAGRRKAG